MEPGSLLRAMCHVSISFGSVFLVVSQIRASYSPESIKTAQCPNCPPDRDELKMVGVVKGLGS